MDLANEAGKCRVVTSASCDGPTLDHSPTVSVPLLFTVCTASRLPPRPSVSPSFPLVGSARPELIDRAVGRWEFQKLSSPVMDVRVPLPTRCRRRPPVACPHQPSFLRRRRSCLPR